MLTNSRFHKKTQGFTIVELLVSIALGVVLMGGIASMYLETRVNMQQDDEMARVQENARYVMDLFKHEISFSGFYGGVVDLSSATTQAVGTDCQTSSDWALNLNNSLEIANNVTTSGNPQTLNGSTLNCITGSELQADSDIITIKRTADTPTLRDGVSSGTEDLNQWYIRTADTQYGWHYLTAAIPDSEKVARVAATDLVYDYWEFYAKVFYIRSYSVSSGDGIPTLCENRLLENAMSNRCLVEGVQDMQFELGVDANNDGVADQYLSTPTAGDFAEAVAVRVHVLMRSVNEIPNYTNEKSYQLGARSIAAFDDGFIRKVFTTTVALRNGTNI